MFEDQIVTVMFATVGAEEYVPVPEHDVASDHTIGNPDPLAGARAPRRSGASGVPRKSSPGPAVTKTGPPGPSITLSFY